MSKRTHEGKVALITGGASGIGAAIGRALAKGGAEVILADRQGGLADKVAAEIRADGGRAVGVELDVRSLPAFERVAGDIAAREGRIDYLFNNAGIAVGGEMDTYEPRDWDDVIDVNLRGVAYGVQAVYPIMIRQRSGHIINTASVAGLVTGAGEGSYCATKHAVVGLSKALRIEAVRHGVRVSVLCPGAIRTPILTGGRFGRLNYTGVTEDHILSWWAKVRPMDVDVMARKTIAAVGRDEAIIVIPRWWKAIWYLERVSPELGMAVWRGVLARMRVTIADAGGVAATPGERRAAV
jgi:NAD(P)-dependent dehydrogenase (short-subunit alcohol dehydrogenase family)